MLTTTVQQSGSACCFPCVSWSRAGCAARNGSKQTASLQCFSVKPGWGVATDCLAWSVGLKYWKGNFWLQVRLPKKYSNRVKTFKSIVLVSRDEKQVQILVKKWNKKKDKRSRKKERKNRAFMPSTVITECLHLQRKHRSTDRLQSLTVKTIKCWSLLTWWLNCIPVSCEEFRSEFIYLLTVRYHKAPVEQVLWPDQECRRRRSASHVSDSPQSATTTDHPLGHWPVIWYCNLQ